MKITAERLILFKKIWYNFTFKMSPRRTIPSLIVSEGLFAVLLFFISSRNSFPLSMLKSFRNGAKRILGETGLISNTFLNEDWLTDQAVHGQH